MGSPLQFRNLQQNGGGRSISHPRLAACTEARSTGPCTETSQLFTKCADLIKEPRVMCAGYLSSPYAESEYMDCMRDTMDYSNICDRCVCTMTGRSDWHMCAVS